MKRLRVLISTHEFSPYQGSECAVGWNIVTRMAAFHDVTVLCADGTALEPGLYSNAVEDYIKKNGAIAGLKIVYVRHPQDTIRYALLNRKLKSLTRGFGWQFLFYMGLVGWHREVFRIAQNLGFENFDVVHQLTPISFLRPGFLWKIDLPFFWGPLGGMYKVPKAFMLNNGLKALMFETLRNINIEWKVRTSRSFRKIVAKASRIWTVADDERHIVNGIAKDKAVPMVDTAPPLGISGSIKQYDGTIPLKICWSGSLDHRKALPLLLYALSQKSIKNKFSLDVLGDGSEKKRWKDLAKKLELKNITWHGRLQYKEALNQMGQADVFVHTSFREAASMVVLEALGWGLPVICHDVCGMAIAVNKTCGIKVPFVNPKQSIQGFCDAIGMILRNPGLVKLLSEGALKRASELSWDAKVKEIAEAYIEFAKTK